mmetsp:Transcript_54623/g.152458  ORF Transcript_54623/g.152458 Transcript_54623/m.152458 type:complete len:235 (+) Transcript_54623:1071-1775(+)
MHNLEVGEVRTCGKVRTAPRECARLQQRRHVAVNNGFSASGHLRNRLLGRRQSLQLLLAALHRGFVVRSRSDAGPLQVFKRSLAVRKVLLRDRQTSLGGRLGFHGARRGCLRCMEFLFVCVDLVAQILLQHLVIVLRAELLLPGFCKLRLGLFAEVLKDVDNACAMRLVNVCRWCAELGVLIGAVACKTFATAGVILRKGKQSLPVVNRQCRGVDDRRERIGKPSKVPRVDPCL